MGERSKPNPFPLLIEANTEEIIRKQSETLSVQLLYGIGDERKDLAHVIQPFLPLRYFHMPKIYLNIK